MVLPSCWFEKCGSSRRLILDCTTKNLNHGIGLSCLFIVLWGSVLSKDKLFVFLHNICQRWYKWKKKPWQHSVDTCLLFPSLPFLPVSGCGCSLQRGFGACVWDVVREPRLPPACYQGSVAMHYWGGKFAITQSRMQTAPSQPLISCVPKNWN